MRKRIHLNAFSMNCVSHIQHGLWVRDDTRQREFNRIEPWIELARLLEKGGFDALFLADVIGTYDLYRGGPETAIQEAVQIPANDPMPLIPAMAMATEHLGFAFTNSVLQVPPFTFARQISTLDHITGGRIAWNIVTSYLPNAGTNLGFGGLPPHDERYARAEEYLEVTYKLWEGSWEEDAVLCDTARGRYADPARIHSIDHAGAYYEVAGPHLSEPSPQRTPMLFQAGSSERGREFAATHAECVFMFASMRSLKASTGVVQDIRARAARRGRQPEDVLFFQGVTPVVGGTEAEAQAKAEDYAAQSSVEGGLAHMSGSVGVDLGAIDLDTPLASLETDAMQGVVRGLIESAPDKSVTFRDLVRSRASGQFLVGTPEQIADRFQAWHEAGVDGFNIVYAVTPGTFADFIEGVVPELRRRGLVQSDYAPGTLREKLFGRHGSRHATPPPDIDVREEERHGRRPTQIAAGAAQGALPRGRRFRPHRAQGLGRGGRFGDRVLGRHRQGAGRSRPAPLGRRHRAPGMLGRHAASGSRRLCRRDVESGRDCAFHRNPGRAGECRRRSRRARHARRRPRRAGGFSGDPPAFRTGKRRGAGGPRPAPQAD